MTNERATTEGDPNLVPWRNHVNGTPLQWAEASSLRAADVIVEGNKYSHVVTASTADGELWALTINKSSVLNADGTTSTPPPSMPESRALRVEPEFLFRRVIKT
jgi:hypothetical protein